VTADEHAPKPFRDFGVALDMVIGLAVPIQRVLSSQWQGEFCRCSIDVVGGKLVASTISSAFDTTQAESGQTNGATDC
jgi:hypothetical protein